MKVGQEIIVKLNEGLVPSHLEVLNESHKHNVPPGSESHFKVIVVANSFEGKNLIERHRQVYSLLASEMSQKLVHALSLHTFTPGEWEKESGAARKSPPCLGGSRHP